MAVFGITAAIGGLLSSTFLSGAIGGAILKAAVGIGLSLAARALAGNKTQESGGINGRLQAGGDVARSIVLGRTCTAGSLVYANAWGKSGKTPNAYFTQVIALADHPIRDITGLWVNGEPVTVDMNDEEPMGYAIPEYRYGSSGNNMWIRWYDGTQTAPDPFLVGTVSSAQRPYSNRRIGKGVAYAIVTSQYQAELFTGFPSFRFEVQGRKLYDVSKDSTAGGIGTHRLSDPATWGGDGDDLLAVQVYNLLLGINVQSTWLYGIQSITTPRLPTADWIAQINKCRQQVQGPDGLEPQFVTGGEITVDDTIGDVVDTLLTGGNARLVESAGTYKIRVGEPDPPVGSINDEVIISTEEQSFTPFFGLSETVNGITATYPEPKEGWNTKAAPPLYNSTFEAEDGNRRLLTAIPMDYVYRPGQVQRLMKAALNEARRARRHTFVLPPAYWTLEPGDVISWTSARNGYVNKLMRVDGVGDRANLDVVVDLTEVDPSDYDWNQSTDYTPPVFAPIGTIYPTPQPIVDWYAEPDAVYDNDGDARRPAIRLVWDGDQVDVVGVQFEVALAATLEVIYRGRTDRPEVGSTLISQGIVALTDYVVRGKYIPGSSRPTLWSGWLPVTTFNIRLGLKDIYPIDVDELTADIKQGMGWLFNAQRAAQEEMDRLGKVGTELDSAITFEVNRLYETVTASSEGLTADYMREIVAWVGPGSALVGRVESLEATVDDPVTGLRATAEAIDVVLVEVNDPDTGLQATASRITSLTATVDGVTAGGYFRSEQVATQTGALSTIGIGVSATATGATQTAAILLSATSSGQSRAAIVANQFVVMNPNDRDEFYLPFLVQNGAIYANQLYVNWARIVDVQITTAQIENAAITSAKIGDLQVKTSNIDFHNVTQVYPNSGAFPSGATPNVWTTVGSLVTSNPQAGTAFIEVRSSCGFTGAAGGGGGTTFIAQLRMINLTTGHVFQVTENGVSGTGNLSFTVTNNGLFIDPTAVQGNNTYAVQVIRTTGLSFNYNGGSWLLRALVWNR
ncbi:phage tail protein [Falsochrobactrum shanghaiense]|uniref:Phage tail protein n=1 Tax=Falsochrobactrum shanghaiense TaxID=2201899 RepID=A0A316JA24_9HYPH|nr:phage tail protein [Falsochrobactrum shanghaiense]PWL18817.1 phage tail protein [Falsochrobactrum shanghaiense]